MEHSLAEQKQREMGDADQDRFKTLDDNPEAHNRIYTDFLERTKAFSDHHPTPSDRKIYERDSYVAQGTFGEGNQEIAKAQASLRIAGYEIGNTGYKGVDGVLGPKTAAALRQLQTTAGLSPTGKLDRQTAELLERMTALGMKKADIEALGRSVKNGSDGHEQRTAQRDELVRQAQDKYPGRDIKIMQAQASLRLAGYDLGKSGVDGLVGEKTKTAIEDYQKARGLKITGELNAETIKALEETVKSGWTKGQEQVALRNELFKGGQGKGQDLVAYAQASLVAAGYDLGNSGFKGVDGKPGPLTIKATKEFQKAHGLEPTGRLDQKTLWALEKATQEGWQREKASPKTGKTLKPKGELPKKDKHNMENKGRLTKRDALAKQGVADGKGDLKVAKAQASLVMAGYDLGPFGTRGVGGELGEYTRHAIRKYQSDKGLQVTGVLDPRTEKALEKATKEGWVRECRSNNSRTHKKDRHIKARPSGGNKVENRNDGFDYEWKGKYLTPEFKEKVLEVSKKLQMDPDILMGIMAFESNIDPTSVNKTTRATGLIQFMPRTARRLGTTIDALSKMSASEQLDFVYKYFESYTGKIHSVQDAYMVVLMPIAVGKDDSFILGIKDSKEELVKDLTYGQVYAQNAGLDSNRDGVITKGEAALKVISALNKHKKFK